MIAATEKALTDSFRTSSSGCESNASTLCSSRLDNVSSCSSYSNIHPDSDSLLSTLRRQEEDFLTKLEVLRSKQQDSKSRNSRNQVVSFSSDDQGPPEAAANETCESRTSSLPPPAYQDISSRNSGSNSKDVLSIFCELMKKIAKLQRENRRLRNRVFCLSAMRDIDKISGELNMSSSGATEYAIQSDGTTQGSLTAPFAAELNTTPIFSKDNCGSTTADETEKLMSKSAVVPRKTLIPGAATTDLPQPHRFSTLQQPKLRKLVRPEVTMRQTKTAPRASPEAIDDLQQTNAESTKPTTESLKKAAKSSKSAAESSKLVALNRRQLVTATDKIHHGGQESKCDADFVAAISEGDNGREDHQSVFTEVDLPQRNNKQQQKQLPKPRFFGKPGSSTSSSSSLLPGLQASMSLPKGLSSRKSTDETSVCSTPGSRRRSFWQRIQTRALIPKLQNSPHNSSSSSKDLEAVVILSNQNNAGAAVDAPEKVYLSKLAVVKKRRRKVSESDSVASSVTTSNVRETSSAAKDADPVRYKKQVGDSTVVACISSENALVKECRRVSAALNSSEFTETRCETSSKTSFSKEPRQPLTLAAGILVEPIDIQINNEIDIPINNEIDIRINNNLEPDFALLRPPALTPNTLESGGESPSTTGPGSPFLTLPRSTICSDVSSGISGIGIDSSSTKINSMTSLNAFYTSADDGGMSNLTVSNDSVFVSQDADLNIYNSHLLKRTLLLQSRNFALIHELKEKSKEYDKITNQLVDLEDEIKQLKQRCRIDGELESPMPPVQTQSEIVPLRMVKELNSRMEQLQGGLRFVKEEAYTVQQKLLDAKAKEEDISLNRLEEVERLKKEKLELMKSKITANNYADPVLQNYVESLPTYDMLYTFTVDLLRKLSRWRSRLMQKDVDISRLRMELLQTQCNLLLSHTKFERQQVELTLLAKRKRLRRAATYHGQELVERIVDNVLSFYLPFKLHAAQLKQASQETNKESIYCSTDTLSEVEFMRLFKPAERLHDKYAQNTYSMSQETVISGNSNNSPKFNCQIPSLVPEFTLRHHFNNNNYQNSLRNNKRSTSSVYESIPLVVPEEQSGEPSDINKQAQGNNETNNNISFQNGPFVLNKLSNQDDIGSESQNLFWRELIENGGGNYESVEERAARQVESEVKRIAQQFASGQVAQAAMKGGRAIKLGNNGQVRSIASVFDSNELEHQSSFPSSSRLGIHPVLRRRLLLEAALLTKPGLSAPERPTSAESKDKHHYDTPSCTSTSSVCYEDEAADADESEFLQRNTVASQTSCLSNETSPPISVAEFQTRIISSVADSASNNSNYDRQTYYDYGGASKWPAIAECQHCLVADLFLQQQRETAHINELPAAPPPLPDNHHANCCTKPNGLFGYGSPQLPRRVDCIHSHRRSVQDLLSTIQQQQQQQQMPSGTKISSHVQRQRQHEQYPRTPDLAAQLTTSRHGISSIQRYNQQHSQQHQQQNQQYHQHRPTSSCYETEGQRLRKTATEAGQHRSSFQHHYHPSSFCVAQDIPPSQTATSTTTAVCIKGLQQATAAPTVKEFAQQRNTQVHSVPVAPVLPVQHYNNNSNGYSSSTSPESHERCSGHVSHDSNCPATNEQQWGGSELQQVAVSRTGQLQVFHCNNDAVHRQYGMETICEHVQQSNNNETAQNTRIPAAFASDTKIQHRRSLSAQKYPSPVLASSRVAPRVVTPPDITPLGSGVRASTHGCNTRVTSYAISSISNKYPPPLQSNAPQQSGISSVMQQKFDRNQQHSAALASSQHAAASETRSVNRNSAIDQRIFGDVQTTSATASLIASDDVTCKHSPYGYGNNRRIAQLQYPAATTRAYGNLGIQSHGISRAVIRFEDPKRPRQIDPKMVHDQMNSGGISSSASTISTQRLMQNYPPGTRLDCDTNSGCVVKISPPPQRHSLLPQATKSSKLIAPKTTADFLMTSRDGASGIKQPIRSDQEPANRKQAYSWFQRLKARHKT